MIKCEHDKYADQCPKCSPELKSLSEAFREQAELSRYQIRKIQSEL